MQPINKRYRRLYTLLPLLFLLGCIGAIQVIGRWQPTPGTADQKAVMDADENDVQPVATPTVTTSAAGAVASAVATPTATVTATPLPTPTIAATATITLLGPPDGAVLVATAVLSFYWQWPLPLTAGQQLTLYHLAATGPVALGSLAEPNLGDGYALHIPAQQLANASGTAVWYVQLETANRDALRSSETRQLSLIAR